MNPATATAVVQILGALMTFAPSVAAAIDVSKMAQDLTPEQMASLQAQRDAAINTYKAAVENK